MFDVDFHILNQKATPAIYADTLANRPAASFAGRLFVDTASPYGIYRDTGSTWIQIAAGGGGGTSTGINGLNGTTNIGLGGTLANNTTIGGANFTFTLQTFSQINFNTNNANGSTQLLNLGNEIQLRTLNNNSIATEFKVTNLKIYSTFGGGNYGLNLDDTTGKFVLGDYNNDRKYNSIVVNDDNSTFYFTTSNNQANTDQDLFYASNASAGTRFVKIGDFNNYQNGFSFIVDDANSIIKTTDSVGINGLQIGTGFTNIGQFTGSFTYIGINQGDATIKAFDTASTSNGLSLDFANELYKFGSNNCEIKCDNLSQFIEFTTNALIFTNAALQSNTSSGNSGEHLVITLNGTQYKIKLENP